MSVAPEEPNSWETTPCVGRSTVELEAETHRDGDFDVNETSERPIDQEGHDGYPASGNGSVHDIRPTDDSCDSDTCRLSAFSRSPPLRRLPGEGFFQGPDHTWHCFA